MSKWSSHIYLLNFWGFKQSMILKSPDFTEFPDFSLIL